MASDVSSALLSALEQQSAAATQPQERLCALGATHAELADFLTAHDGGRLWRIKQIWAWIYRARVTDFADMSNVSAALRAKLAANFSLERPRIDTVQAARDGVRKYRFVAADNTAFEAVYIPEVARGRGTNTLCISSQSGCAVGCKFCFTASLRRNRNLSVH